MASTSKEFLLNNKTVTFTSRVDETDNSKIYTSRYFFVEVQGRKTEMTAKSDKQEYYDDIAVQLNSLQGKSFTEKDFFLPLLVFFLSLTPSLCLPANDRRVKSI
jgi:hypothetical protein